MSGPAEEARERMPEERFPWTIKQVGGALKACINDHGPIDRRRTFSAAKRIVNQLYGATAPTQANERLEAGHKREQRLRDALSASLERERRQKELIEELLTTAASPVDHSGDSEGWMCGHCDGWWPAGSPEKHDKGCIVPKAEELVRPDDEGGGR